MPHMDCEYYCDGLCKKFHSKQYCRPSLTSIFDDYPDEFISKDKMCEKASIFGNYYIGLTKDDIKKLLSGEIAHIGGEYGIFIGYIGE